MKTGLAFKGAGSTPALCVSIRFHSWIVSIFLLAGVSWAQTPYKNMLDDSLEFSGPDSLAAEAKDVSEIRIGLFAPDEKDAVGRALIQGVSLALELANAEGGYQGVPFRLARRWADNPWGAGSKEVIRLVYEDRVWALIGSVDSESTHVAQQIATKSLVPLLSPVAADSTLTYVRVPWIFRLPPSDATQALCLVREGIRALKSKRVGIINSTHHDSRMKAEEIKRAMETKGLSPLFHLEIPPQAVDMAELGQRVNEFQPDGLAVHLFPEQIEAFVRALEQENVIVPLYLPWIPGLQKHRLKEIYSGTVAMVSPFAEEEGREAYKAFAQQYEKAFRELPNAEAAYAFDAAQRVVQGIIQNGLSRKRLHKYLNSHEGFTGVTGPIRWDNGGGNTADPLLVWVRNSGG